MDTLMLSTDDVDLYDYDANGELRLVPARKQTALIQGQTDHINLSLDLDLQSPAYVQKFKVSQSVGSKGSGDKQVDGWTEVITFSYLLILSVTTVEYKWNNEGILFSHSQCLNCNNMVSEYDLYMMTQTGTRTLLRHICS